MPPCPGVSSPLAFKSQLPGRELYLHEDSAGKCNCPCARSVTSHCFSATAVSKGMQPTKKRPTLGSQCRPWKFLVDHSRIVHLGKRRDRKSKPVKNRVHRRQGKILRPAVFSFREHVKKSCWEVVMPGPDRPP